MFRIIESGKGSFRPGEAVFGFRGAMHRTPRRYKHMDSAINSAKMKPGTWEIMNDEREIVAVVRAGKVLTREDMLESVFKLAC